MDGSGKTLDLGLVMDAVLPAVGDRRRISGEASASIQESRGLEFSPGSGVSWALELRRISGGVEVEGDLGGILTLECYRCLEEYEFPFRLHLREHVLVVSEEELERADDYADEYIAEGGILDPEPLFRDAISLAIPTRHLCREGCLGLCQRCGVNRNLEPCSCDVKRVDARLRPLEDLKRRLEERGGP